MSPENAPPPLSEANEAADAWQQGHGGLVTPGDFEKMLYVVKNLARDWSQEFESERKESYGLICDSLVEIFEGQLAAAAKPGSRAVPPRVLVPGCGLARLCVDLVQRGFDAIGNEHSYFMLLTSAYILNGTGREKQWTVFPWVLQQSNNWSTKDQLQSVQIPDMCPADMVGNSLGSLGMIAGDFIEVFTSPEYHGEFDAVATCFFIDTAHNVIEYMEILWDILKVCVYDMWCHDMDLRSCCLVSYYTIDFMQPGGVWINLGPLQWHWADSHTYLPEEELSLELPLDSVIEIAKHIGFEIELDVQKESKLYCRYMSNPDSMRPQGYDCAFWVARKPKAPTP